MVITHDEKERKETNVQTDCVRLQWLKIMMMSSVAFDFIIHIELLFSPDDAKNVADAR